MDFVNNIQVVCIQTFLKIMNKIRCKTAASAKERKSKEQQWKRKLYHPSVANGL